MTKPRRYATPGALRQALEERLKQISKEEGVDLPRIRRAVTFDRLLTRLFAKKNAPWVLKGGYAMELRIKKARATKDLDLTLRETLEKTEKRSLNEAIREALQRAADIDLGDFFVFTIGPVMQDLDGAPYGGARFPIDARMDGRTFVRFHIDVGVGDVVLTPLEMTEGRKWLDFAGIPRAKFPTISKEQQFAEKIHAYTLPRERPNTRVRDLVDLFLLIRSEEMDPAEVRRALKATFDRRKTHDLPETLKRPPESWKERYRPMARECGMSEDIAKAFDALIQYFST